MRVTVIADEGDDDMGFVGERLEAVGGRFERFHRDAFPDTGAVVVNADVLLLLGSDRSVHDVAERQVVAREQGLVRASAAAGLPVLAICYGAQLVASAAGAEVAPAGVPEFGWKTIETDETNLVEAGPWFEFHYDAFGEIPGVPAIARTPDAPQAFVHGRTLAVQFHPEVTSAMARKWVSAEEQQLAARGLDPDAILEETARCEPEARIRCFALVDRFLAAVAERPPLPAR